jgi:hypothetical protein
MPRAGARFRTGTACSSGGRTLAAGKSEPARGSRAGPDILRAINREDRAEDRAIVRVRVRIHRDPKVSRNEPGDQTLLAQRVVSLEERWTLARRNGTWRLASVSGDPISEALIGAPSIPSPIDDDERLVEAGLRELAERNRAPRHRRRRRAGRARCSRRDPSA